ncbi:MAG: DegQ family serine endoprotease [Rhodospirillales bacterium]|nr:DegQ family serine endoprotease [Rhodospirillales bacterium]
MVLMAASTAAQAKAAPESFADLAEKLLPSVVNISTTQTIEGRTGPELPQVPPGSPFEDFFKDFFDRNSPQQRRRKATSLGSGFIIDVGSNGDTYVVTNNHVIAEADEITVILQDDTRIKAELVGRDPKTDIAILKIKSAGKLKKVSLGNSDKSRVGDWVVAIGNPFGLGGTVTAGIISARGRDINSGPYDDFIQTDASINRGNSGGPMFNLDGEVIGINTAIFSPSGGSVGIGFAIPSSTAKPVISQLIKHGEVKRGWLGVHIQTVTDEIAEALGLKDAKGALVASVVEGGPAEKSKIKAGDVVLTFDGKEVDRMRELPRIVAETEVNKPVKVKIWRDSKLITIDVTVGELEDQDPKVASKSAGPKEKVKSLKVKPLGLTLSSVSAGQREKYKLEKDAKGVVVVGIEDDGPAAEKGVRVGDLIVEVNQQDVESPAQVAKLIEEARDAGRRSVLLLLEGQGGLRHIGIRIGKG